jgi:protein SCO1
LIDAHTLPKFTDRYENGLEPLGHRLQVDGAAKGFGDGQWVDFVLVEGTAEPKIHFAFKASGIQLRFSIEKHREVWRVTETGPPPARLNQVRILLWILVALAIAGTAALVLVRRALVGPPQATTAPARIGGPFTLIGGDGKPFSSSQLAGKPYAIYFGFTRCADVCPTTLSRLVRLRREAASDQALNILFVTIDPTYDGPREVGQYATLFNAPIIGLTGTPAQIDRVKKQYGIYAAPNPHAAMGQEMMHSAIILLFGRDGKFVTTIAPDEPDSSALAKIRTLLG